MSAAPLDLVDLLFDLERLEVVEFGLVGLELGMELVLAGFFLFRWLESALHRNVFTGEPQGLLTVSLRSNRTTRPPLSPVAR